MMVDGREEVFAQAERGYRAGFELDPLFAPHARSCFEVLEGLGEGGMGVVYRVRDRRFDREAALKLLNPGRVTAEARARFRREAAISARLIHPSIPPVHEIGRTEGGETYVLMKLIEGETLARRLARCRPEEPRPLLEILVKVAEAVDYAHSRGVVHRDLKPENIMIGAFGEVLVMDWGLAAVLGEDEDRPPSPAASASADGLTRAGSILGTVGYLAPEQAQGQPAGPAADVFALGVILTEVLTGEPCVPGETETERLLATAAGRARPPRRLRRRAPAELDSLARAALQLDPARRLASAARFAEALRRYLADERLLEHRYGLLERLQRLARRRSKALLSLVLACVIALGITALWLERRGAAVAALEARNRGLEQERVRLAAERERDAALASARSARAVLDRLGEARDKADRGAPVEQVRACIEAALSETKRSYRALIEGARIYRRGGHLVEARALLEEGCEAEPPAYEALLLLHQLDKGEASTKARWTPYLERIRDAALARGEENEYSLLARGFEAQLAGRLEEAERLYRAIARYSTRFPIADLNLGSLCAQLGRHDEALALFDRALERLPDEAVLWRNRAGSCLHLGRGLEALSSIKTAIRLEPGDPDAFYTLGLILSAVGSRQQAIAAYDRALFLEPESSRYLNNRGHEYQLLGFPEKALVDFDKAIAIGPVDALLLRNRGRTRVELRQLDGAIEDLTRAIALRDADTDSYIARALAYSLQGRDEEALADLAVAAPRAPGHAFTQQLRAEAALRLGREALARESIRALEAAAPGGAEAELLWARLHQQRGEAEAAAARARAFLAKAPRHAKADEARALIRAAKPGG